MTGSIKAALLLQQLLFWDGKQSNPDGWIYKTEAEFEEETTLSRHSQARARDALVALGLITVERRGVPARLYYRVDAGAVESLLLNKGLTVAKKGATCDPQSAQPVAKKGATITREDSEKTQEITHRPNIIETTFNRFWDLYPKKVGKRAALKAWKRIKAGPQLTTEILARLQKAIAVEWAGRELRFIADPATWLNGHRWEDAVIPPVLKSVVDDTSEGYRTDENGQQWYPNGEPKFPPGPLTAEQRRWREEWYANRDKQRRAVA